MYVLPGTNIEVRELSYKAVESLFNSVFLTGGLVLSQVSGMTDCAPHVVQNWVKRGWVKSPEGKRYGEDQVVRIILINMMRGSMQMEQIAFLMSYINGSVEDRSDDILPDRELFNILCSIIYLCEQKSVTDTEYLDEVIKKQVERVNITDEKSRKKLETALRAMVLAILSTQIKAMAQEAFASLI